MSILVIGGFGFIGSHILEALATICHGNSSRRIYCVSRSLESAQIRWGSEFATKLSSIVTRHFVCNRDRESIIDCAGLAQICREDPVEVIIDVSCYTAKHMENSLNFVHEAFSNFGGRLPLYVYISSDSVYEVCHRSEQTAQFLVEEDAIRPDSVKERLKFADFDPYGEGKLAAEELLRQRHGNIPFVALRLPDVIGPRDNIDRSEFPSRWLMYQLWIRLSSKLQSFPVHVPSHLMDRRLSFIYAKDVANFIANQLYATWQRRDTTNTIDFVNQAFNFAWPDPIRLPELLILMCTAMAEPPPTDFCSTCTSQVSFYPSVTRGPIDIAKLLSVCPNFAFTPLDQAIGETTKYFEDSIKLEPAYRTSLKELFKEASEFVSREEFEMAAKELFSIQSCLA